MGVYQPLICGLNLVLLCSSTALLYLGSILINFYLLPTFDFYSSNFASVPYLILSIGFLLFLFSILGFVAAGSKSRIILAVYVGLMVVTFCLQIASIFCTIDFRNELELEAIMTHYHSEMDDDMALYWKDEDVKARWDTLQRDFQCCGGGGGQGFHTGYKDWERVAAKMERSGAKDYGVPLSCCLDEESGCAGSGSEIFEDIRPWRKIYVHGCMTIVNKRLQRDILPVLLTYIGCAGLLALIQILSVVLSSAYIAAISRKSRRDNEDRMGMYRQPQPTGGTKYSDTIYSAPGDSGVISGTDSLRSNQSHRSLYAEKMLDSSRLEAAPPRTPLGSTHRSSLYIEPSNEAGKLI